MSVTLHTTLGDLKIEVYCDSVPRVAENFLAHCAAGTYDGTIFHRNIKNFMVQGGDPTNTGKGGECIWGGKLKDQFDEQLRHNKRGIVSMAGKGPDTIGSQFFILYDNAPHLNNVFCVVGGNRTIARVYYSINTSDSKSGVELIWDGTTNATALLLSGNGYPGTE